MKKNKVEAFFKILGYIGIIAGVTGIILALLKILGVF